MSDQKDFWDWIKTGNRVELEKWLALHPEDLDAVTPEGISAILFALYYGQSETAEMLIERGAWMDIFSAAAAGHLESVKSLVNGSRSAANQYSIDGYPLLALACYFGQYECADYLITQGAAINAVADNSRRVTALHAAAAANRTDIVRLLLEHGASVDARQEHDFTALHTAAQNGNLEMVKLLLQYHASPTVKTDAGKTALDLAGENHHPNVVEYLQSLQ